jgi:hypothetical protein
MSTSPTPPPVTIPARTQTPHPAALSNESDTRLQAALSASAHAEASLSGLFRAIQHLDSGLGGAREANELLTAELEGLREVLGRASDQQLIFERKVAELESVLDRTEKEHDRERAFLIDQQDAFLVKLLDEQEADLKHREGELYILRGRIRELELRGPAELAPALESEASEPRPLQLLEPTRSSEPTESERLRSEQDELARTAQKLAEDRERARETVARLLAQRDEAQTAVLRISKERDDALLTIHRLKSELGGPRIPLSTRPPRPDTRRESSGARTRVDSTAPTLDQLGLEARLERPADSSWPSSPSPSLDWAASIPTISSVLNPPPGNPNAAPLPTRLSPLPSRLVSSARQSPPPDELQRALPSSPPLQSSRANRPPLQQQAVPSSRPLGGYSLDGGSIETEHLEGAHVPSRSAPPGSGKR